MPLQIWQQRTSDTASLRTLQMLQSSRLTSTAQQSLVYTRSLFKTTVYSNTCIAFATHLVHCKIHPQVTYQLTMYVLFAAMIWKIQEPFAHQVKNVWLHQICCKIASELYSSESAD